MTAKLALVATHPNRKQSTKANPTPAEVRRAREAAGLTLEQAGAMVYTTWRTWQNWEAPTDSAEHRRMHAAAWELFQVKLAALQLREKQELPPSLVRKLGLELPDPQK